MGAGAGTGGNVRPPLRGEDAWCRAVVASECLRDTHRPKWVSPIGATKRVSLIGTNLSLPNRHPVPNELNLPSRRRWARRLCWVFSGAVVLAVAAGAYLSLPTIWSDGFRLDPNWGILWWVLVGLFLLPSVLGVLFTSWSVQQLVATASSWCERCILKALLPKDGSTEITRKI